MYIMEVKGSTQGHTSPREVGKIPSQLFGPLIWGLEKEMATHFIILAWRLPRTEELGGLQTIRSQSQTWLKQLSTSEVNRTHCTFWVLSTMKSETLCPTWESVSTSLLFTAICKASADSHFAFLHFFFSGMVLITSSCTMLRTSILSSSGTLVYQI